MALDHFIVSVYAVDMRTHQILLDRQSDISLIPASCMKLVTTGAAFSVLGPEMRFQTDLEYDGKIDASGVLHGNLYIRGGGDPCLGSERLGLSWKMQIDTWVKAISDKGIKRIEGEIIGDATLWEKALAVPSWSFEDVGNYYGAGASALSFHENAYSLVFKPGQMVDTKAEILRIDPPISKLSITNEVKTGSVGSGDMACIYGLPYAFTQFVRGTVPAGVKEFVIKGAIPDPVAGCVDLLSKTLESKGIHIRHKEFQKQSKRIAFHTTHSPPIKDIVYFTNQKSINLYAEHLLKKLGEAIHNEGSTDAGIKAITHFWRSQEVDLDGFYMSDGSGLSRKNLITTKQLVTMLLKIKDSPHFPMFLESLPQKKNYRAKSGYMSHVRSMAGYTDHIAFAIIVNHALDSQAKRAIENILSELTP